MIATGLDRLLGEPATLAGRRYGVLGHAAAVSAGLVPIHLALIEAGAPPPLRLFGPEHGFYAVEEDMIASADAADPWTGVPVVSLYGDTEGSLRPAAGAFDGLDLLVVDLQDVGSRYYTFAATAVWAAEAALAAGLEIWVLDRPNPLGGERVEGNRRQPGFESFVGAFELPVRHGLTLGELVRLEGRRRGWPTEPRIWEMEGWRREMGWEQTGRTWIAPSPNMPTPETALVYPGACLLEATGLSEGRGTTRPFLLAGSPCLDPVALARRLRDADLAGVSFVPAYFKPQFHKHAGRVCGGVRWVVTDAGAFRPYRAGVALLGACRELAGESFRWRDEPYEFVADRPAIDLLAGDRRLREALEGGGDLEAWLATWEADEAAFREERRAVMLYPEAA